MWDRASLKHYAKEQLRMYYWMAFAVCLVGGILGGSTSSGTAYRFGSSSSSGGSGYSYEYGYRYDFSPSYFGYGFGWFILVVFIFILLLAVAYIAFVAGPVSVGMCSFFLGAPWGRRNFGQLFSGFQGGRYLANVKTMFLTNLYIFLWSLLLIIPGIVKAYQYRMVPYLISENPHLTPEEAMFYSTQMTDGEKWEIFVLDLSFIGWYFLGALALGIGVLFVHPYVEATGAQLYFALRPRVVIPPPVRQW